VVAPGSRCPACGRSLGWTENVPVVSYVIQGGRCRACGARIALTYPLVEVATAALFAIQYAALGWQPILPVRLVFCSAMVVLFVVDLEHRILPDVITLPGIAAGLLAALVLEPGWRSALTGVVVGGGGLLLVAEVYYRVRHEEGLGMGDVKMLAMIGAFLGWPLTLLTLLLASLLGSIVGIGMLATGLGDRKYALPLGSFLSLAAVVATVAGDPIIHWYLDGRFAT